MKTESTPNLILQDYLTQANAYYKKLEPDFQTTGLNGYWVLGCILDSMIDFLLEAGRENIVPYSKGAEFLNNAAVVYLNAQSQGEWYDDWMWWGNATSKVFDPIYKDLFDANPDLKHNFTEICIQTFTFVKTGKAPYNPLNPAYAGTLNAFNYVMQQAAIDPKYWREFSKAVEPRWNMGCWQGPMTPENTYNPLQQNLGPFQDSVVNGLFYILTQRTLHSQKNLGTQQEIDEMTAFYNNWMNDPGLPSSMRLFNRVSSKAGLFRERVSVYKNGTDIRGYDENLAWSGDQGLMLSALTNLYFAQSGSPKQASLDTIKAIINGVVGYAIGDINQTYKNVIMPWCHLDLPKSQQPGMAPGGDTGDYFSGTGVFMRGLLESSRIPEVRELIKSANVQLVLKNTLAALLDKDKQGNDTNLYMNFVFAGNPPQPSDPHEWFNDFNKMAALLVASQLIIIED